MNDFNYSLYLLNSCLLHYLLSSDNAKHFKKLSSLHTSVFKTFNKKKLTSPLLNYMKGNTSRFGSAIQLLPSDIGK